MTIDEALDYFKSGYRLRKMTGLSHNSFTNWRGLGYIPPLAQFKLAHFSNGALKVDKRIFDEHEKFD